MFTKTLSFSHSWFVQLSGTCTSMDSCRRSVSAAPTSRLETHKPTNTFNMRACFPLAASHEHTRRGTTITSAQLELDAQEENQQFSTSNTENAMNSNITAFIFAPGHFWASLLQPSLHPWSTPAVLGGGDLSHVARSPEDGFALWPHEVRGRLPAGTTSLTSLQRGQVY